MMWRVAGRPARGSVISAVHSRAVPPEQTRRPDPPAVDGPAVAEAAARSDRQRQGERLLRIVSGVVAPTTLITALALFFGWTRTSAQIDYFGLDPTVVGFSNQDYLLRSADTLFRPLGGLLLLALLAVWIHALTVHRLRAHPRALHRVRGVLLLAGCGLLAYGVVSAARGPRVPSFMPLAELSPGLGAALITYATHLRGGARGAASEGSPAHRQASVLTPTLASLIMVLSLFWAVSQYANALGTEHAQQFVATLVERPGVEVYSRERLQLTSGGVLEALIGDGGSAYRFRYSGLRLLVHSTGSYFLLPASWSPRHGAVIVLPESPSIRFEYTTQETGR